MILTPILHGTARILTFSTQGSSSQKGTRDLNGNSTVRVQVGRGGTRDVAHVRLRTLGAFADRLGLADAVGAHPPAGSGIS
jgi:hypothetical protein